MLSHCVVAHPGGENVKDGGMPTKNVVAIVVVAFLAFAVLLVILFFVARRFFPRKEVRV